MLEDPDIVGTARKEENLSTVVWSMADALKNEWQKWFLIHIYFESLRAWSPAQVLTMSNVDELLNMEQIWLATSNLSKQLTPKPSTQHSNWKCHSTLGFDIVLAFPPPSKRME